jgi:hypothetical protein
MTTLLEEIKAYANAHYEESFGAQTLIECYSDKELLEEFSSMEDVVTYVLLKDEQYDAAWLDADSER